jgi:ribose transport system ATP-binding protein
VSEGAALRLAGIGKSFPGVRALHDVSFELRPGEVHALVGENGAGKSTLLKILSGAHRADAGTISLGDRPIEIAGPRAARALGIAIIYQELSLVPWLSVAHNIFLGREHRIGRGLLATRRLHAAARAELERIGSAIDPATPAGELGVAEQQMVEIAKALAEDVRFILMDEPTASLSERETGRLFEKIAALRRAGVGVAYISHRLAEIARIADRVTVLRDGCVVLSGAPAGLPLAQMIAAMVGRPIEDHYPARARPAAAPPELIRVEPPPGGGLAVVARAGEVVGLAGLVGAGRTEWAWRLVGAAAPRGERVFLAGREVRVGSPRHARRLGIGMVPENRKQHGLVLGMSVRDNATITVLDRLARLGGFIDRRAQATVSGGFVERLGIRCPGDGVAADALSGGNQQKVVLAKWLARDCRVMVLDEPTRGIDVGAKLEMYRLINDLCRAGRAVILVSSELPEILSMCDRVYVMHGGAVVAELDADSATQEEVLRHASGLSLAARAA